MEMRWTCDGDASEDQRNFKGEELTLISRFLGVFQAYKSKITRNNYLTIMAIIMFFGTLIAFLSEIRLYFILILYICTRIMRNDCV